MKAMQRIIIMFCLCLPLGLFAQSVDGTWTSQVPDGQGGTMAIKVTMDNGTYSVDIGGDGVIDINGKYEMADGKMTIQDTGGSQACNGKGVYMITINGNSLKMSRVSDECEGRGGPEGVMMFTKS